MSKCWCFLFWLLLSFHHHHSDNVPFFSWQRKNPKTIVNCKMYITWVRLMSFVYRKKTNIIIIHKILSYKHSVLKIWRFFHVQCIHVNQNTYTRREIYIPKKWWLIKKRFIIEWEFLSTFGCKYQNFIPFMS